MDHRVQGVDARFQGWREGPRRFGPSGEPLVPVYHAVEHLAGAGRQAFGDGAGLAGWLDDARRALVGDGYCGVVEALARRRLDEAAAKALNYFCGHRDRLGYAARLLRGMRPAKHVLPDEEQTPAVR